MSNCLIHTNRFDHTFSERIHDLDKKYWTFLLYPFARLFNPKFIIIPLGIIVGLYRNLIVMAFYVCSIIISLGITLTLKKLFKRKRPEGLEYRFKTLKLRSKELNHAMPSGDSLQSGNFSAFVVLFIVYQNLWWPYTLGYCLIVLLFQLLIMLSRVYYLCHFVGDTIVGMFLGVGIGTGNHYLAYLAGYL